jgi:hypothetical protein
MATPENGGNIAQAFQVHAKRLYGLVAGVVGLLGLISVVDDARSWFRFVSSWPRLVWVLAYLLVLVIGMALLFDLDPRQRWMRRPRALRTAQPASVNDASSSSLVATPSEAGHLEPVQAARKKQLSRLLAEGMALRSRVTTPSVLAPYTAGATTDANIHAWEDKVITALDDDAPLVQAFLTDKINPLDLLLPSADGRMRSRLNDRIANLTTIVNDLSSG